MLTVADGGGGVKMAKNVLTYYEPYFYVYIIY